MTEFAGWSIPRDHEAIKCPKCRVGYAERVSSNMEERKLYTCGRENHFFECCARAFVCASCGTRSAGKAAAPEMD